MRVIAKRTLREFYDQYGDAKGPLEAWHAEALKATWATPHDIKAQYGSASIIDRSMVVFNIGGNKYRLVVDISWARQIVFIKRVVTHNQYDRLGLGR